MENVEIGKVFDLHGEPTILELYERIDIGTGKKHYNLKLEMIGRKEKLRFSREEVEEKKLRYVPLE